MNFYSFVFFDVLLLIVMFKSYKFRIYPDIVQENFFIRQFGCCRYVYNTCLSLRKEEYENNNSFLSYGECCGRLTELKNEHGWLRDVDSTALVQSLRDQENAFQLFFKEVAGYPKFKAKYNYVQSYRTQNINNSIRIEGNRIRLPKVGFVAFRFKKRIRGRIISVTVKRSASGKYFASVLCKDVPQKIFKRNNRSVGLDMGIKNFVTINTGKIIAFPETEKIQRITKKIRRIQRKLSRKTRGSNNYNKIKKKLAENYEKIHNTLNYHFHKIAQVLVEKYQIICLEKLNIWGMLKNKHLSQSIQEKSWNRFQKILEEKASEHGRTIIYVDQWYPSSKTCHNCGYHYKRITA